MNNERDIGPSADPARNEPPQARTESCDFETGGREPDATDFLVRMFKRAAVIGAARLEVLHAKSEAEHAAWREAAAAPEPDAAAPRRQTAQDRIDLEYQRTTREMRYCALLIMRLQKDRHDREAGKIVEEKVAAHRRKARLKDQLERLVGAAIQHEAQQARERALAAEDAGDFNAPAEPFDEERLYDLLPERLEEEDIERDIDVRAMGELVVRLCRENGFEPDLSLWKNDFWALEEARLQTPGSPFAGRAAEKPAPQEAKPPTPDVVAVEPEEPAPPAPVVEDPKPPEPEPDSPYETRMKARLKTALHSGAWSMALRMDPALTEYLRARLLNSS